MWAGNFTGGESAEKWGSGYYSQMTRDRTHRHVHRIDAVSVQPLVRRGGAGSIFRSAAVGAVTSVSGVADVAPFEETVARSEWCEQVRNSLLRHGKATARAECPIRSAARARLGSPRQQAWRQDNKVACSEADRQKRAWTLRCMQIGGRFCALRLRLTSPSTPTLWSHAGAQPPNHQPQRLHTQKETARRRKTSARQHVGESRTRRRVELPVLPPCRACCQHGTGSWHTAEQTQKYIYAVGVGSSISHGCRALTPHPTCNGCDTSATSNKVKAVWIGLSCHKTEFPLTHRPP